MKIFIFLFLIVFGFINLSAQERYVKPVDEANQDASFSAFRAKLLEATKKRDAKYILSIVDWNIKIGFGGDDGIANFKKTWKLERRDSEFWNEFLAVISNGGRFEKEGTTKTFYAPFLFNAFPDDVDSFEHSAIFGNNVNLREKGDAKSKVVAQLSYNIVKVDFENSIKKPKTENDYEWLKIETLGGKKGFVNADFVRSPIDYRAAFEKIGGKWKLTFFGAGD